MKYAEKPPGRKDEKYMNAFEKFTQQYMVSAKADSRMKFQCERDVWALYAVQNFSTQTNEQEAGNDN